MRKIIVILLLGGTCLLAGFFTIPKLLRYIDCKRVIGYLEYTKTFLDSDSSINLQAVSVIDEEIQKIRKTQTYNLPIVLSVGVATVYDNTNSFHVCADWIQKRSNPRRFKNINIRFEHEDYVREFTFSIPQSEIANDYTDKNAIYSDAYYVCFTEDPNTVCENSLSSTTFVPYKYSKGLVFVSLVDNAGNATRWLKCNTVKYN